MLTLAEITFPECVNNCPNGQFWFGLACGFILCLIIWAIVAFLTRSKNSTRILTVEDSERGSFSITPNALSSFLKHIIQDYPDLDLEALKLENGHNGVVMNIIVRAAEDADLLNRRKELRDRVYAELEAKLGIADQIEAINIEAIEFVEGSKKDAK
ncbi:MAG: hypothetical protein IJJ26_07985 [Victivallales bacterium]|nr:hypothetical protein [Victivallales bacterium]